MAKHKISYWEVQVRKPSDELYVFGKKTVQVEDTFTTVEEEICKALHAAKSSYLPVGQIPTEAKKAAFALLAEDVTQLIPLQQFPYGTTAKTGAYLLSKVRYGRNNEYADAVDLESNAATSLKGKYQTRSMRTMLVFPQNSTSAYAALETISGQNPRTALENFLSEKIFGNTSEFHMTRILDSNYLATILQNYEPREISLDVPKNAQIGKSKSSRINLSTGLDDSDRRKLLKELKAIDPKDPAKGARAVKNAILGMMNGKAVNGISGSSNSRNYKVQLFDKGSDSSLVLDLDAITRDFDIPLSAEEVKKDESFYSRAADILKYVG